VNRQSETTIEQIVTALLNENHERALSLINKLPVDVKEKLLVSAHKLVTLSRYSLPLERVVKIEEGVQASMRTAIGAK
jgi:hypothetical protein